MALPTISISDHLQYCAILLHPAVTKLWVPGRKDQSAPRRPYPLVLLVLLCFRWHFYPHHRSQHRAAEAYSGRNLQNRHLLLPHRHSHLDLGALRTASRQVLRTTSRSCRLHLEVKGSCGRPSPHRFLRPSHMRDSVLWDDWARDFLRSIAETVWTCMFSQITSPL